MTDPAFRAMLWVAMPLVPTNAGHRRSLHLLGEPLPGRSLADVGEDPLVRLYTAMRLPWTGEAEQRELVSRGWAEILPEGTTAASVVRRYRRNPIEHVTKGVIEFTTRCNFSCPHCYNRGVERRTEEELESLAAATDCLLGLGVREFAFIGGEVSAYGQGWLDLARRLRAGGARLVALLSNGWFLGKRDFEAAGRRYADQRAFFRECREHGLTHLGFSVDGRGAEHDRSRGQSGLYGRILEGLREAREAGLAPRVSLLLREGADSLPLALELGRIIYPEEPLKILREPSNIWSSAIDIAAPGPAGAEGAFRLDAVPAGLLRCAGFYRPAPHLTLKANGELATCRIATAGEGYGNFHERPLVEILNRMQEAFPYRLHAERRIGDYLPLLDPSLFGSSFSHACALRGLLSMLARAMHEEGIEPGDRAGVARANAAVARMAGRGESAPQRARLARGGKDR